MVIDQWYIIPLTKQECFKIIQRIVIAFALISKYNVQVVIGSSRHELFIVMNTVGFYAEI